MAARASMATPSPRDCPPRLLMLAAICSSLGCGRASLPPLAGAAGGGGGGAGRLGTAGSRSGGTGGSGIVVVRY